MHKTNIMKTAFCLLLSFTFLFLGIFCDKIDVAAATFPPISVEFDPSDQSVIVSGVPAKDASGNTDYMLRGYLNYGSERIETFSYAPSAMPYHIADKQAYIFNWSDAEFLLPCSGEYQFTAYLVCGSMNGEEAGPKTTINITLTKKDESTNWGPGLPNTTVESYDLKQMQGKDKNITIEEEGYTWTINGQDITTVPEKNLSLAITKDSETFQMNGVEEFFGETIASKFSIEHDGEFGFKANLKYTVGTEYAGKYANLFYVVGDGTFQFMEGGLVDENGNISYTFTHASDYVIAITDTEYTGQELNPKVEEPVINTETDQEVLDTEQPEETGDDAETPSIMPFLFIGILVILVAVFVVLFIKKNKQ